LFLSLFFKDELFSAILIAHGTHHWMPLAETLGSAETWLKNTDLVVHL